MDYKLQRNSWKVSWPSLGNYSLFSCMDWDDLKMVELQDEVEAEKLPDSKQECLNSELSSV